MFRNSIIKIIEKFKPKIKTVLSQLINMIHKWKNSSNMKHYDLLKLVLDESGYSSMLKKKDLENENKLENLKELLRAMQDYDSLQKFFRTCCFSHINWSRMRGAKVNLMTMHALRVEFELYFFLVGRKVYFLTKNL